MNVYNNMYNNDDKDDNINYNNISKNYNNKIKSQN